MRRAPASGLARSIGASAFIGDELAGFPRQLQELSLAVARLVPGHPTIDRVAALAHDAPAPWGQ
jgi:hypothetical protein